MTEYDAYIQHKAKIMLLTYERNAEKRQKCNCKHAPAKKSITNIS